MLHDLVFPDEESSAHDGLERAVADACRLLGGSDSAVMRSITVVGGRRLSGAELLRLRVHAQSCGVQLVMAADGAVTLRREEMARSQFDRAFVPEVVAVPDAVQRSTDDAPARRWASLPGHRRPRKHGRHH